MDHGGRVDEVFAEAVAQARCGWLCVLCVCSSGPQRWIRTIFRWWLEYANGSLAWWRHTQRSEQVPVASSETCRAQSFWYRMERTLTDWNDIFDFVLAKCELYFRHNFTFVNYLKILNDDFKLGNWETEHNIGTLGRQRTNIIFFKCVFQCRKTIIVIKSNQILFCCLIKCHLIVCKIQWHYFFSILIFKTDWHILLAAFKAQSIS